MIDALVKPAGDNQNESASLADLFLHSSRELARSDARLYRSIGSHLTRTREILNRVEAQGDGTLLATGLKREKSPLGAPSFERQTRKSLENLCKLHGVRGYSRMSKATMILRLQETGVEAPPITMEALSKEELLMLLRDLLNTPAQDA